MVHGECSDDQVSVRESVFDRLSVPFDSSKRQASQKKKKTSRVYKPLHASVNMISRGSKQEQSRRKKPVGVHHSMGSSDSDYSPGLGQVLVGREGVFQGTRSKAAVPYTYPTGGSTSPKTMRSIL